MPNKILQILLVMIFCGICALAQASSKENLRGQIEKIALEAKGRVGVALTVLETGDSIAFNGGQQFPMQSVYKFPIGMAVLHQVDQGKLKLNQMVRIEKADFVSPGQRSPIRDNNPQGISMSLKEILRYSVSESDGTACDVLLRVVGGAQVVTRYLQSLDVNGVIVATTEKEMATNEFVQYRNWAKPQSMIVLLRAFQEGRGLLAASRELLLQWMIESPTGPRRLKGLLPAGTIVAHKTGTSGTNRGLTRATNDVGLITLPDGRHLAIAVFVSDSRAGEMVREAVIAKIAKAAWDFWSIRTKAQAAPQKAFPLGDFPDGDFIATFTGDGKFIIQNEALVKAKGDFVIEGDRILFPDDFKKMVYR
jgi:beta-lactamase class A